MTKFDRITIEFLNTPDGGEQYWLGVLDMHTIFLRYSQLPPPFMIPLIVLQALDS